MKPSKNKFKGTQATETTVEDLYFSCMLQTITDAHMLGLPEVVAYSMSETVARIPEGSITEDEFVDYLWNLGNLYGQERIKEFLVKVKENLRNACVLG